MPNEHEISVENIVTKLQKLESDIVELTPEQIIDYIRKEYPTVENFDAIKSWRTFSIP